MSGHNVSTPDQPVGPSQLAFSSLCWQSTQEPDATQRARFFGIVLQKDLRVWFDTGDRCYWMQEEVRTGYQGEYPITLWSVAIPPVELHL